MKRTPVLVIFVLFSVLLSGQNNELVKSTKFDSGDVGAYFIESPSSDYCGLDHLTPAVWVKNYGLTTVDSCRVMYRLDFFPAVIKYVEEEIAVGDSILVTFDNVDVNSGSHAIQFSAYFPNGSDDGNTANNSVSGAFEFSSGKQYRIELLTDNYAYETSWTLIDDNMQTISNNGTLENGTLYQTVLCLSPGCYTFSIFDSFGDGICGSYGTGYFNIIDVETEAVVGTGCDYGDGTTVDFCVDVDEGSPFANFSNGDVSACTGEVSFFDNSLCNPEATEWLWSFGDGNTSIEQNPIHAYSLNGMYDVSLQVTNVNGTHTLSIPNYVEIIKYDPPLVEDEYYCSLGETVVFHSPDGYGDFNWFSNPNDEIPELTYHSFTLENLQSDSIIYYQYIYEPESQYVGLEDNSGVGGYFGFGIERAVYFDAYTDITIKSCTVFANGAEVDRTFTLKNSGGITLDTRVISIPEGKSVIYLDFQVPPGVDYAIHVNASNNLAYTGDYGDPNIGYPFTIPDLISITGNNYGEDFWYFFYNIEVFEGFGESCPSDIVPVQAILEIPSFSLGNDTTICVGNSVELAPDSDFITYVWNNDSTSNSIDVFESGTYSLSVTDEHSCTAENSVTVGNYEELVYTIESEDYAGDVDDTGQATVSIVSGSEPVDILWSNESTDFIITSLLPGTYYCTITDNNDCEYIDSVMIQDMSDIIPNLIVDQFSLYPNPVSEILYIKSENGNIIQMDIFDIQGRLVEKQIYYRKQFSVDVSDLSKGVYFVELDNGEQRKMFKVIKE